MDDINIISLDLSKSLKELQLDYPVDKDELAKELICQKTRKNPHSVIQEKLDIAVISEGKMAFRNPALIGINDYAEAN